MKVKDLVRELSKVDEDVEIYLPGHALDGAFASGRLYFDSFGRVVLLGVKTPKGKTRYRKYLMYEMGGAAKRLIRKPGGK